MEPATWENCRADFEKEFIDLLVPGKGLAVWEAFWAALRSGPFPVRLERKFKYLPLPRTVAWIFDLQQVEDRMITAEVPSGPVTARCFFDYAGEGEDYPRLSINCEEMVSAEAFDAVLAILRYLSRALAMPVFAVPEVRDPPDAFLRVSPDGQAVFLPPGPVRNPEPLPADPGRDVAPCRRPRGVPVPSHLAGWLGPLDWRANNPYLEGDVVCPCGRHDLEFHYPGQTHHPPHLPEPIPCVADGAFAIKAVCRACGRQAVVFDHRVHGLTRFLNAALAAGKELPPLTPWACSSCGGIPHRGRVHFRFQDPEDFLLYVEGACALERWGDGIEWFGMKIECCGCGHKVDPWAGYED